MNRKRKGLMYYLRFRWGYYIRHEARSIREMDEAHKALCNGLLNLIAVCSISAILISICCLWIQAGR